MIVKKYVIALSCIAIIAVGLYSCEKPMPMPPNSENPYLSAGDQTIFDESSSAFGDNFPVLRASLTAVHESGENVFNEVFVPFPSAIPYSGLGPIYNNSGCGNCHAGLGEGNPPASFGAPLTSMLIRISIPGVGPHNGPNPVPGFGGQLQNNGVGNTPAEGTVNISYTNQTYSFADGTTYSLQIPTYAITNTYIPFPGNGLLSPRIAPRMVGLGLLEAVPESEILEHQGNLAVGDTSHINGQPNYVWDFTHNQVVIGRFGWKAEAPTLLQQLAGAYNEDMGITNYVFPQESSYGQSQYNDIAPNDPTIEISDSELNANVLYCQTVAVPARRNVYNAQVVRGQQVFQNAQCASCHLPTLTTSVNVAFPEMSNITLHAYTDMLLHDMGAALADNRPTYTATGRQWRTQPLWGIGLTQLVNPSGQFLHDGRARNLMEAIMWHGGEATASREYVRNLNVSDRNALIAFLQSL